MNRPSLIRKCHPLPGISDHEIIYLESSTEVQLTKMSKRKILVWSRADITASISIGQNFNTCFLEKHSMTSPVNTLWDEFQDMCQRCLDFIPIRLIVTSRKQPWISPYIRWLSRRKQRMYNSARSSQSPFYWQKYQLLKKRFKKNAVRLIRSMYQLQ